jgi:hypothetical protein
MEYLLEEYYESRRFYSRRRPEVKASKELFQDA